VDAFDELVERLEFVARGNWDSRELKKLANDAISALTDGARERENRIAQRFAVETGYKEQHADLARLTAENEKLKGDASDFAWAIETDFSTRAAAALIKDLRAQLQAATAERDALDKELQKLRAK
jgi:hypothetical protein